MNSIDILSKYTDTTRLESLAKDVIVSNPDNDSETVASLPEPAPQEASREKKLVIKLAEWSLKYPVNRNITAKIKREMEEELLKIERAAKKLLSEYNKEDNKNT